MFPKCFDEFAALSDPAISSGEFKAEPQRGANNMKAIKSVEPVVDFLAEELKREEKKAAREAKHARMAKLVNNLKARGASAGC